MLLIKCELLLLMTSLLFFLSVSMEWAHSIIVVPQNKHIVGLALVVVLYSCTPLVSFFREDLNFVSAFIFVLNFVEQRR